MTVRHSVDLFQLPA